MKNRIFVFLIIFAFVNVSFAKKKAAQPLSDVREYERLKKLVELKRDSLKQETLQRWRLRQKYVKQKELDKYEIDLLRDKEEKLYNTLLREKEELFTYTDDIDNLKEKLQNKKDEAEYFISSFNDIFEKERQNISESFPTLLAERQNDLTKAENSFLADRNIFAAFDNLFSYYDKYINEGANIRYLKKTVAPDGEYAKLLEIVKFGNVFGYCMDDSANVFIVNQSGRIGAGKYVIKRVNSLQLKEYLVKAMPDWISGKSVKGSVFLDILQNSSGLSVIEGDKSGKLNRLIAWFKSGGIVMYFLAALILWAVIIIVLRSYALFVIKLSNERDAKILINLIEEKNRTAVLEYAGKRKSIISQVVNLLYASEVKNRKNAEKLVKEILIEKLTAVNKHLPTLSVIAAAAPLLGLLGTVSGMITLFKVITNYGTSNPKILAGGISQAIVTTQFGLYIAIPVLLIHNFLRNRSIGIQNRIQAFSVKILNRIWPEE